MTQIRLWWRVLCYQFAQDKPGTFLLATSAGSILLRVHRCEQFNPSASDLPQTLMTFDRSESGRPDLPISRSLT